MSQGDVTKFRATRIFLFPGGAFPDPLNGGLLPPVDGPPTTGGTIPHFQMSPTSTAGMATTGFIFMIKSIGPDVTQDPAATVSGFNLTVWVRDPNTFRWGSMMPVTGIAYGQLWLCSDVNAMDGVYFQVAGATTPVVGNAPIDIHFAEQ